MGKHSQNQVHAPGPGLKERAAEHLAKHPWQARAVYLSPLLFLASLYLARVLLGEHSAPASGLEYHAYFTPNPAGDGTLCAHVDLASNPVPDNAAPVTSLTHTEARGLETDIDSYIRALDHKDPASESKFGERLVNLIHHIAQRSGLHSGTAVNFTCTSFDNISPEQAHVAFNQTG